MHRCGMVFSARYLIAVLALATPLAVAQEPAQKPVDPPRLTDCPILMERRLELTRRYAHLHYGLDSEALKDPRLIVVHYTGMATLSASLAAFQPDLLPAGRTDIAGHGDVNVGVHYLIAGHGAIYRLLPESVMGRHTIGYNWCALGIEMVAGNEADLTRAQLLSCAHLVAWIVSRHPSIEFLIGHHEYRIRGLPHASLFLEKDPQYWPAAKVDPGERFMRSLRALLARRYGLGLRD